MGGDSLNRFQNKSRGFYAVVSRNYRLFGDLGFHGGGNYSLESKDGDRDPSFWVGMNKSIFSMIEVSCEYDFATNDNEHDEISAENGFLNTAVKWRFGKAFTLEFDLKNILRNRHLDLSGHAVEEPQPSRELRLYYIGRF